MDLPWVKYLKFILSRTLIFYIACFLVIWHMLNYAGLIGNAVPQTMSRLTPPIDYFSEFVSKEDHYDQFKLMNCINYHRAVAHFFPFQGAEAYGMLGFCYERLGRRSDAIQSYQHAISLNPDYFWPYYDLGVIDYKKGDYTKAGEYFNQALQQEPLKTMVLLSRSKVYNDVRLSQASASYDFLQGLKQGRAKAYILMLECLYKSGSYLQLSKPALEGIKEGMDQNGILYFYAGAAAYYQNSFQQAMELLQIALQKDPQNADAIMFMGMCLKMSGQPEMAKLLIDKAARLHKEGSSAIERDIKPRVCFF